MKRWLRWNLRCLRGRRCAGAVRFESLTCTLPGWVTYFDYECPVCDTGYRVSAVVGHDGNFTQTVEAVA